ncbi:threonine/serine exporter family protein [uncultured Vagococcus sp.]|uniref:threonine/serine exporter family protein n=1 Tax=uncultured Vagococcus sp. TaxID=189676 RepID=UPI0028D0AD23|nr:threonine/serine exporter family protein [uncultured Vagococcus sp.]
MLIKLCFSFIASSATAVLYNVERRLIVYCGMSGMFTWLIYSLFSSLGLSEALASLLALLSLTFLSRLFNKITQIPNMIFNISGIMPIVPGGLLFKTFNNLADKHYEIALTDGFQAVLVAGAIAVGFIVNEVLTKYLFLIKKRMRSD